MKIIIGYTLVGGKEKTISCNAHEAELVISNIANEYCKMGENAYITVTYPQDGVHISNAYQRTVKYFNTPIETIGRINEYLKEDGHL